MPSMKKLLLTATVILLSKNVFGSDCSELESAIGLLGSDFKSTYNTNDCCTFSGVVCDSNKNVIGIKFHNVNGSQSDISEVFEKLANLKSLTSLDLSGNGFAGYFPYSLTKLKSLKSLDLSHNKFNGTIPFDAKDLTNLEQLNLEGNPDIYGYVPIRNVTSCNYGDTNLCNLPNASCKSASKECTIDDVNKTNEYNGYPTYSQSSADRSVDDSNARATSTYYDDYVYGGYNNYGNGYDNSGYGYGNTGYGYGNTGYGYGNNGYNYNYYEDDYGSPIADLFKTFIGFGLFSLLALICCLCCICRTCCGSDRTPGYTTTTSTKPFGLYQTNNTATVHKPTKPTTTTINVNNQQNPYVNHTYTTTNDITNINTHSNYSMPNPNGYQQGAYPPQTYNPQYGQPYGYGVKRDVEEVKEVKVKTEEK